MIVLYPIIKNHYLSFIYDKTVQRYIIYMDALYIVLYQIIY